VLGRNCQGQLRILQIETQDIHWVIACSALFATFSPLLLPLLGSFCHFSHILVEGFWFSWAIYFANLAGFLLNLFLQVTLQK